ncbi:MAG: division/cell wall cluster transcriptional repressor MraZ [Bacteroidaceae bacterium]|jgi:MraZ protein|nr:division/cell wall cluster transcriptional repressor MraZ [Bacteroidaceae bacterium]
MRFVGDFQAKTDAKGRVFLPAAFRKILEAEGELELVLRRDVFQHCLVLYPESVWNQQLDELKQGLNQWNREHQMMLRQFLLDAEVLEWDSQGRILLSKRKMQYAGIENDVRFLAMVDRIEIWGKQEYEKLMEQSGNLGDELEQMFGQDNQVK